MTRFTEKEKVELSRAMTPAAAIRTEDFNTTASQGSLLQRWLRRAAVVRELLKIHPDLTVSGWRARTQFLEDSVSIKFGDAMRLAGLPG